MFGFQGYQIIVLSAIRKLLGFLKIATILDRGTFRDLATVGTCLLRSGQYSTAYYVTQI